ncbi:hypothetical protein NQ440_004300, partial [Salmonella enterica]|nr:hypothetical protein [Salmonella enterica]
HAVDIHQPVFEQVSCINLYDQHFPASPDAGKHIDGLSQEAVEILKSKTHLNMILFFWKRYKGWYRQVKNLGRTLNVTAISQKILYR